MAEKKIAAPIIPDAFIAQQATRGEELRDKQSKPRFAGTEPPFSSGQNVLLHALLGLQAGTKAGLQTSPLQSPLVSLLAGLGAGAGVPGAVEEMGIEKIGNRPVDEVSPDLVKAYPQLQGVPLSLVHKLTPLIQSHDRSNRAAQAFANNAALRIELQRASPSLRRILAEQMGVDPSELSGLKSTEASNLTRATGVGRPLTAEVIKLKNNAEDGIININNALELFDRVDDTTLKQAAVGGLWGKVGRMGNEDAQQLNKYLSQASDVITRLRTGAALNANEERYYGGIINDFFAGRDVNRRQILELQRFFEGVVQDIEEGRRAYKPSSDSKADAKPAAKADPAGVRGGTKPKNDPLGVF